MAFRSIGFALLLSGLLLGCGTVANLATPGPEGGKTSFGGVSHDMAGIKKAQSEESLATHSQPDSAQVSRVAHIVFCAADLPFSLIGDVLAWPYTCAYTFINEPVPVPSVTQAPIVSAPQIQIPATLPMIPPPPMTPPVDPMIPPEEPLADPTDPDPATLPLPRPTKLP